MTVFVEAQLPVAVVADCRTFDALVHSAEVPSAYLAHPNPPKSFRAYHLSPAKARRAAERLASMLETVAYRRDWTEEELS